jgi:hypothetical protein
MVTETVAEMRSRLAAQDVEIAELGQRVAVLEDWAAELRRPVPASVAAPPRKAEPDGVRIFHPQDRPAIELPNDQQMCQLAEIVLAKYPKLGPDTSNARWRDMNVEEFHRGFCASFRRIASLNRTDEFNTKRGIRHFVDEAEDWYRAQGQPTDIRWPCYLAAAIAAGDVPFVLDGGPFVGLRLDGIGRPATAAWRDILQGRALRAPSPPPGR